MAVGQGKTLEQLQQEGWSVEGAEKPAPLTPEAARAAGHPEAKISAAAPGQVKALAPDAVDQFGIQKAVGPKANQVLTTPLIKTGSDIIDSFLSPASLALMAATGGAGAVSAVRGAVADLSEVAGAKMAGKLLKFVTPSLLKKPAELASILSDLAEAYKGKAAPVEAPAAPQAAPAAPQAQTPTPAPAASPAPAQPAAGDIPVVNRTATAADYASDIAHMRARGQTPSPQIEALARGEPAATVARPDAFKAALKAFDTAKETPRPAEASNVAALIMRGKAPEEALATVLGNRPPSPAAELAKRLGTPSEAEMNADMAARARKGQKSLMPKYGATP